MSRMHATLIRDGSRLLADPRTQSLFVEDHPAIIRTKDHTMPVHRGVLQAQALVVPAIMGSAPTIEHHTPATATVCRAAVRQGWVEVCTEAIHTH